MSLSRHLATFAALALLGYGSAAAQETSSDVAVEGGLVLGFETIYQRAAERAAPNVVALWVTREEEERPRSSPNRNSPWGGGTFQRRPQNAPVSGTIIEDSGYILTSYFNVSGKLKEIKVQLTDEKKVPAKLVGYHVPADIALVKIDAAGLPTLDRAPLEELKVGTAVVALGRAPNGKALSLNPGILSAPARLYGRGVQTDVKLNYGNVGGPLVDASGRLIGVTCKVDVKTAATFGQNSGVSFAITWNKINEFLPDLKKGARILGTGQPFLGVIWDQDAEEGEGVPIQNIIPGGSADQGGIRAGDIILEFDGVAMDTFDDLRQQISKKAVGDEVMVRIRRGEKELELTLKLGERPGD